MSELVKADGALTCGSLLCTLEAGEGAAPELSDLNVFAHFMQVKYPELYASLQLVLRTPHINPATGERNSRMLRDPVATLVPYCIHNFSELSQQQIDAMHAWTQLARQALAKA
jgi:hypothetical protein